jgi:hypothetical protein
MKIENAPDATRPWMPKEYGVPATKEGMLTWEHVTGVIKDALNYWIATTSSDGRPHVRPVWAAWMEGILYFDGHPATGWGRNIARDPRISVQVEVGDDAVILEGTVQDIAHTDPEVAERLAEEFNRKYLEKYGYDYTKEVKQWQDRGLFSMMPSKVLAWNVAEFSTSPTKWTLDGSR